MTALTLTLSDKTAAALDRLSTLLHRTSQQLVAEAIDDYVSRQQWQIDEIKRGMVEADAGDFATEHEVEGVMARYLHACGAEGA